MTEKKQDNPIIFHIIIHIELSQFGIDFSVLKYNSRDN